MPTTASTPASALALIESAEAQLRQTVWPGFEATCHQTFARVLAAMTRHKLGPEHFYSVTGYGHNDLGREVADAIFADALQAEAALVRPQIVSGTHALAVVLNGCLGPGDTLVCLTGAPYDTLEEVLGLRGQHPTSLTGRGANYIEHSVLGNTGNVVVFTPAVDNDVKNARAVWVQRSRGYSSRPTLTIAAIAQLVRHVKALNPDCWVLVDNCYGEFVEPDEPTAVGADIIAGSLIKNPGGGLMPTGGYIAGRQDLIERCATALTAPGIGRDGGYTFGLNRLLFQGLFMASSVVCDVLKGMTLAAYCFSQRGMAVKPTWDAARGDIIQQITLGSPQAMVEFCRTLQAHSPVDSAVRPEPSGDVPGYADPVVMAGGTFIEGATVELSADGPIREPYAVYLQGGLHYAHVRHVMATILANTSP
jgi:cystathionine beta-lyase family protein involved in aluminum resistance